MLRYRTLAGPTVVRSWAALVLLLAHAAAVWASGQLPLVTDVPGSPSAGALEFDAAYGFDRVRRASDGDVRPGRRTRTDMTVPNLLLDYGITDRVQVRIDGAGALTRLPGRSAAAGFDDISTGIKYRFLDQSDDSDDQTKGTKAGATTAAHEESEKDEDRYAREGPVSASVSPQFSFPTGPRREGIREGEYSLFVPVDVSREIGVLTVVGEGAFLWRYHHRAGPNEFELGIAAFYDLTPKWALLGEQRVNLPSVGQGTAEWLFNLGAQYEVTDQFAVFGSAGRTFRASSRVEERPLMFLVGIEITYGEN